MTDENVGAFPPPTAENQTVDPVGTDNVTPFPAPAGTVPLADEALPQASTVPIQTPEAAAADAEALLKEESDQFDGSVSVDELVAAYGAAKLQSDKFQNIMIKQFNEISRLRATLRNVLDAQKAAAK